MKRIMTSLNTGIAVSILATAIVQSAAATEPEYRYAVFDLGGLSGDAANAFGISDAEHIVGTAYLSGNRDSHAVLFEKDGPLDLGTFGGLSSNALDVNSLGHVVGWANNKQNDRTIRAFLWEGEGTQLVDLGTLGGSGSAAWAINEAGQIVGQAAALDGHTHAVSWNDGDILDLGSFADESQAYDINEAGQIVGWSQKRSGMPAAVLWQNNEMVDLGALYPSRWSEAYGINDLGHIVGWSNNENFYPRALLWVKGRMYNLQQHTTGIRFSVANAINNNDQIVGFFRRFSDGLIQRGFLWEQGKGMQALDDLVPPNLDLRMEIMFDINNNGQIAGIGEQQFGNKWFRAVLLTPVSPELSLSDPVPGIAGRKNTWTVTGAQPESRIVFTYSRNGGGTVVPGCDKLDAVMQLKKPKVMKIVTADVNGEASIQMFVPGDAAGKTILFQAVVVNDCAISQLTGITFE